MLKLKPETEEALDADRVRRFVFFDFLFLPTRAHCGEGPIEWDGHRWNGVGSVLTTGLSYSRTSISSSLGNGGGYRRGHVTASLPLDDTTRDVVAKGYYRDRKMELFVCSFDERGEIIERLDYAVGRIVKMGQQDNIVTFRAEDDTFDGIGAKDERRRKTVEDVRRQFKREMLGEASAGGIGWSDEPVRRRGRELDRGRFGCVRACAPGQAAGGGAALAGPEADLMVHDNAEDSLEAEAQAWVSDRGGHPGRGKAEALRGGREQDLAVPEGLDEPDPRTRRQTARVLRPRPGPRRGGPRAMEGIRSRAPVGTRGTAMKLLTGEDGLRAMASAGEPANACFALDTDDGYPAAPGGEDCQDVRAADRPPEAGRRYGLAEFHAHLRYLVRHERLHVLELGRLTPDAARVLRADLKAALTRVASGRDGVAQLLHEIERVARYASGRHRANLGNAADSMGAALAIGMEARRAEIRRAGARCSARQPGPEGIAHTKRASPGESRSRTHCRRHARAHCQIACISCKI